IGRSKPPPSLGRSAGARFTVMRRFGNWKPLLTMALLTRSLLSRTAASGSPTMDRAGSPLAMCTSIATAGASMPTAARLWTSASVIPSPPPWRHRLGEGIGPPADPHATGSVFLFVLRLYLAYGRRLFFFQGRNARFQRFQLRTRTRKHLGLRIELLAGD